MADAPVMDGWRIQISGSVFDPTAVERAIFVPFVGLQILLLLRYPRRGPWIVSPIERCQPWESVEDFYRRRKRPPEPEDS
jgi:hypothetical protein